MSQKSRLAKIAGFLLICFVTEIGTMPMTIAQDARLFERLSKLIPLKGYNQSLGVRMCGSLGLADDKKGCSVYQVSYTDESGFERAINVFEQPRTHAISFIIYKRNTMTYAVDAYLTNFEGKPRAASSMNIVHGSEKWSKLFVDISPVVGVSPALNAFAAELYYWRSKYFELEMEPDHRN